MLIFKEIRPVVAVLICGDGRTDIKKLISAFDVYAGAPDHRYTYL
jgi:hypothetical protein